MRFVDSDKVYYIKSRVYYIIKGKIVMTDL